MTHVSAAKKSYAEPSREINLILELHPKLGVSDDVHKVVWAAFDWYFVPRSDERIRYVKRAVEETLQAYHLTKTWPAWLWRVHALLVREESPNGIGISPPLLLKRISSS